MKTIKNDKLDYLLYMVAAECCKTDVEKFDSIDDSKVDFSEDFCKKRDRIIRKYKYRPFLISVRKVAARAAIVLMAIMSAAFITVMAVEPLREAVFEAVIEWYDDYLTIRYERTDETDGATEAVTEGKTENGIANEATSESTNGVVGETTEESTDESTDESTSETETVVNEVTPPTTIEEVRKPTNLPDGVVEDVVIQNSVGVCIDYYLDNELIYSFEQLLLNNKDQYVDNESAVVCDVEINGNAGMVVEYTDKVGLTIVWNDGEYIYHIYSEKVDSNDLIVFAQSVG